MASTAPSLEFPESQAKSSVRLMSLYYTILFCAFNSAQSFATSRSATVGSLALGLVYLFLVLGNVFIAVPFVRRYGDAFTLRTSALTYVAWVAAAISFNEIAMYAVSCLVGLGAALIWTAQAVFVKNCSEAHEHELDLPHNSTLGSFNGLFFSYFQNSLFLGNLLVAFLFSWDVSVRSAMITLTGLAIVGNFLLFNVKDSYALLRVFQGNDTSGGSGFAAGSAAEAPSTSSSSPSADSDDKLLHGFVPSAENVSSVGSASESEVYYVGDSQNRPGQADVALVRDDEDGQGVLPYGWFLNPTSTRLQALRLLVVVIWYSGLTQFFLYGDYPSFITDDQEKFYVLAVLGLSDVLCSYVAGIWSDRVDRIYVLTYGAIAQGFVYLYLFIADDATSASLFMYFVLAILYGSGDAVFNTQLYSYVGSLFGKDAAEPAFAILKLHQALGTAAAFFIRPSLAVETRLLAMIVSVCIALGILHYINSNVEKIK